MPRWEVQGFGSDGRPLKGRVNAESAQAAAAIGKSKGLRVTSVRPLNDTPEAKALEAMIAGQVREPAPESVPFAMPVAVAPIAPPAPQIQLIACPACGSAISPAAPACPRCGHPIAQPLHYLSPTPTYFAPRPPVHVIEKTGKEWKIQILFASLTLCVGIILLCAGGGAGNAPGGQGISVFGVLLVAGGFIWLLIAKFGAWWNHG